MAIPLVTLTRMVVLGFLLALGFVILAKLVNGDINTRYLFCQMQRDGTRVYSSGRVQLLVFTLLVAIKYLYDVCRLAGSGYLPDIPNETLVVLGGSHALYLGGKAYSTFLADPASNDKEKEE
jgi:hypothetical protein